MVSEQRPDLPNRQTPFSEAFKKFIAADWAPYAATSPTVLPGAIAAASPRDQLSARYPGERLIVPAGGLKVRSNDTDHRFRPHSAFTWLTGLGTDRESVDPAGTDAQESSDRPGPGRASHRPQP